MVCSCSSIWVGIVAAGGGVGQFLRLRFAICWITIGEEDLFQLVSFLSSLVAWQTFFGSGPQAFDDA